VGIGEWIDLMADTITLEPCTGADAFGAKTYGAATAWPACIEGKVRRVSNAQGQEQTSMVTVYVGGAPGAVPQDRVTLPARFPVTQPPLIAVGKLSDENGAFAEVLYA